MALGGNPHRARSGGSRGQTGLRRRKRCQRQSDVKPSDTVTHLFVPVLALNRENCGLGKLVADAPHEQRRLAPCATEVGGR